MHLRSDKYPNSILFCLLWSIIGYFLMILDINNTLRIIIVLPMIIFIPGYLFVYVLFPTKKEVKGLGDIQRIALSFGVSLSILPLIGLILYYTFGSLKLQEILIGIGFYILVIAIIALFRWFWTPPNKRYSQKINFSLPKHETKLDKLLTSMIIICFFVATSLAIFVILTPKQQEHFTEFYILGPTHLSSNYPLNITEGENATVIIGIVNHENTIMKYSIEVWLSNQTTVFKNISNFNESSYNDLWFMDKINITLINKPINLEELSASQWEYNYTFHINRKGIYKLVFLLYTTQTQNYVVNENYKTIATEKVDDEKTSAYRSVYLWINVISTKNLL